MHQIQLATGFRHSPFELSHHLHNLLTTTPNSVPDILHKICAALRCRLTIYSMHSCLPLGSDTSTPTLVLYYDEHTQHFDSVTAVFPPIIPKCLHLCTWNLLGVASPEQQLLLDTSLDSDAIDLAAVQETHMNCHRLETHNYYWLLGPQTTGRSSRGIGFLIHKRIAAYVTQFTIITVNIAYILLSFPCSSHTYALINIHKLSNGHPLGSLETGNQNATHPIITPLLRPLLL
jgi:hypothetical protein